MRNDVRIAISTDQRGFTINATLIASILRRTERAVHVRCWCRGFLPESFESGRLKVEFLPAVEEVTGKYPGNSGPAAYDRLLVIRDCPDWDRCMVMDYDQLVLCDMAPLFDMDLGDHLLAAHMQGPGVDMDYAMRVWLKRPIPEAWEHVGKHPYFLMPPLLNLKAMREAGTWETFLAAHSAFGADEQLSLTAATEGRSLPLERKWNLFPRLHIREGEVPEGIIHWSGWPKPWHKGAKVWRPDVWEAERSSWEHLKMGIWEKPLAVEVEPMDERHAQALWARGWRVKVWHATRVVDVLETEKQPAGGDFSVERGGPQELQAFLAAHTEEVEMLRFGPWSDPGEWLEGCRKPPAHVTLTGCLSEAGVNRVRAWGYDKEFRIKAGEWPAGGPLPRVLNHVASPCGDHGLAAGEWLYLKRTAAAMEEGGLKTDPGTESAARDVAGNEIIALAVVATGRRARLLESWLRSVERNFLPGHQRRLVVFTDAELNANGNSDWRIVRVPAGAEGIKATGCHGVMQENWQFFEGADYVFLLDAAAVVTGVVGREVLGDGLTAVTHAGFHGKHRSSFTYERREDSTAYVGQMEGSSYYTGAVQGGRAEDFRDALSRLVTAVESDQRKGVCARWGSESHWNRVLVDTPPVVELPPSHGRPEWQAMEYPLVISLRPENP